MCRLLIFFRARQLVTGPFSYFQSFLPKDARISNLQIDGPEKLCGWKSKMASICSGTILCGNNTAKVIDEQYYGCPNFSTYGNQFPHKRISQFSASKIKIKISRLSPIKGKDDDTECNRPDQQEHSLDVPLSWSFDFPLNTLFFIGRPFFGSNLASLHGIIHMLFY